MNRRNFVVELPGAYLCLFCRVSEIPTIVEALGIPFSDVVGYHQPDTEEWVRDFKAHTAKYALLNGRVINMRPRVPDWQ